MRRSPNVVTMLAHRLRRLPNIVPTLDERLVLARGSLWLLYLACLLCEHSVTAISPRLSERDRAYPVTNMMLCQDAHGQDSSN